jgi:sec-independent protein translocase protein TatA
MFGIGGGELMFIILVVLMLFGSDKIPDIARTLGKGIQQLKNATNDIKSEIHNSADVDDLKKTFSEIGTNDVSADVTKEIEKAKEDIEDMSGPIKRQY